MLLSGYSAAPEVDRATDGTPGVTYIYCENFKNKYDIDEDRGEFTILITVYPETIQVVMLDERYRTLGDISLPNDNDPHALTKICKFVDNQVQQAYLRNQ